MEITSKGMTTTKKTLINLKTTIYYTNHQEGQLVDFLKKYLCVKKKTTLKKSKVSAP